MTFSPIQIRRNQTSGTGNILKPILQLHGNGTGIERYQH